MSGQWIDPEPPPPHTCDLPHPTHKDLGRRWECDCGQRWKVGQIEGGREQGDLYWEESR